jgi:hypothetical protein
MLRDQEIVPSRNRETTVSAARVLSGQRRIDRIDERSVASEGFGCATAREPISNIGRDNWRESCRNQARRLDNSFL